MYCGKPLHVLKLRYQGEDVNWGYLAVTAAGKTSNYFAIYVPYLIKEAQVSNNILTWKLLGTSVLEN